MPQLVSSPKSATKIPEIMLGNIRNAFAIGAVASNRGALDLKPKQLAADMARGTSNSSAGSRTPFVKPISGINTYELQSR
jgi:hypothetical protein